MCFEKKQGEGRREVWVMEELPTLGAFVRQQRGGGGAPQGGFEGKAASSFF